MATGGRDKRKPPQVEVDLLGTTRLLSEHVTQALCEASWDQVRQQERKRVWSLTLLVKFWIAVILRRPESLTDAIGELQEGRWEPLGDGEAESQAGEASQQALFKRCQTLSWRFFAEVFRRFVVGKLIGSGIGSGGGGDAPSDTDPKAQEGRARAIYCRPLRKLQARFPGVYAVDGSKLDRIAKKLKILWKVASVVLPGCLVVAYDLFRGIPRVVRFCADAARYEGKMAKEAMAELAIGSLVVADRLYATLDMFEYLGQNRLWGVFRRNRTLTVRRVRVRVKVRVRVRGGCLSRISGNGLTLEDWLVRAGSGNGRDRQVLRQITIQDRKSVV